MPPRDSDSRPFHPQTPRLDCRSARPDAAALAATALREEILTDAWELARRGLFDVELLETMPPRFGYAAVVRDLLALRDAYRAEWSILRDVTDLDRETFARAERLAHSLVGQYAPELWGRRSRSRARVEEADEPPTAPALVPAL